MWWHITSENILVMSSAVFGAGSLGSPEPFLPIKWRPTGKSPSTNTCPIHGIGYLFAGICYTTVSPILCEKVGHGAKLWKKVSRTCKPGATHNLHQGLSEREDNRGWKLTSLVEVIGWRKICWQDQLRNWINWEPRKLRAQYLLTSKSCVHYGWSEEVLLAFLAAVSTCCGELLESSCVVGCPCSWLCMNGVINTCCKENTNTHIVLGVKHPANNNCTKVNMPHCIKELFW